MSLAAISLVREGPKRWIRPQISRALAGALIALAMGAIGVSAAVAADGYKVIVHSSNPASSLPREQVARFFLKQETAWPSGQAVKPVDLERGSPTRAAFSTKVVQRAVPQVVAYLQQRLFSGRATPPPEVRTPAEVVSFVEQNEGAIGYVSEGTEIGRNKVVRIVP